MRKILRERSRNPNREVWESPSVYGGEDVNCSSSLPFFCSSTCQMARPASGRNVSRPVFCRFSIRKYSLGTCVGIISHSQTIALYKNQTSLKWYPHSAPSTVTLKILSKSSKRLPALNYRLICLPSRCTTSPKNLIVLILNY